jgi:hypothetical protein
MPLAISSSMLTRDLATNGRFIASNIERSFYAIMVVQSFPQGVLVMTDKNVNLIAVFVGSVAAVLMTLWLVALVSPIQMQQSLLESQMVGNIDSP